MPDNSKPPILLRTTDSGSGRAHGLTIGIGETLEDAVTDLDEQAQRQVAEVRGGAWPTTAEAGSVWEVAGIRITAGPADSGSGQWVAYGTLVSSAGGYWAETGRG